MLNKKSQMQKSTYLMIPFIRSFKNNKNLMVLGLLLVVWDQEEVNMRIDWKCGVKELYPVSQMFYL